MGKTGYLAPAAPTMTNFAGQMRAHAAAADRTTRCVQEAHIGCDRFAGWGWNIGCYNQVVQGTTGQSWVCGRRSQQGYTGQAEPCQSNHQRMALQKNNRNYCFAGRAGLHQ